MVGSAVASPVLVDASTFWHLDVLIFLISCGGFALLHRKDIFIYGPLMLPISTLFGLATYSSARTPLRDLVPWMPIVLSLFLLLTTYTLPRFWPGPDYQGYSPIDRESSLEEGHSQQSRRSSRSASRHDPARENYESHEGFPIMTQYRPQWFPQWFREHQVSHMSRPTSRSSRFPTEERDSDIDLHEYPLPGRESPSIQELLFNPGQPLAQQEFQSTDLPRESAWRSPASYGEEDRSSSADSHIAQCNSTPGRSESPSPEDNRPDNFNN